MKPLGEDYRRTFIVPGVTAQGRWGGVRLDGPTTAIPDGQFRWLQNTRREGNEVVVRGGESKATSALSGTEITGIYQSTDGDIEVSPKIIYFREV